MQLSLWSAATAMRAKQKQVDVIANNLANVNTQGYKKQRLVFEDLMYTNERYPGVATSQQTVAPAGLRFGAGVNPVATQSIYTQGSLKYTGGQLDLSIEGAGFFQVLLPDGTVAYTRDGSFKVDADGRLVTNNGYPLVPEVYIPANATEITIGPDGTISVIIPGQSEAQIVGQIELANFVNPGGLANIGRNLVLPTAASGEAIIGTAGMDGFGTIGQGYLEMSNVDAVEEMVELIAAQRAYEMSSKAIQTADAMLQTTANLKRS